MTIEIGRMRHRVAIQQLDASTQDSRGAPTQAPSTMTTIWAEIRPLQGRELFTAQQRAAQVTHGVTMRYPGFRVTPEMQLNFNGRVFDILAVLDVEEQGVELQILAKERL